MTSGSLHATNSSPAGEALTACNGAVGQHNGGADSLRGKLHGYGRCKSRRRWGVTLNPHRAGTVDRTGARGECVAAQADHRGAQDAQTGAGDSMGEKRQELLLMSLGLGMMPKERAAAPILPGFQYFMLCPSTAV